MARLGLARLTIAATLAAALAGCLAAPEAAAPALAPGEMRLSFEDMLAPAIFDWTGPVVADPEGAGGLWAVVPGLARPERARIALVEGGASVNVALFRGAAGRGGAVRISAEAAAALGIGEAPARARVTALRREPRIAAEPPVRPSVRPPS